MQDLDDGVDILEVDLAQHTCGDLVTRKRDETQGKRVIGAQQAQAANAVVDRVDAPERGHVHAVLIREAGGLFRGIILTMHLAREKRYYTVNCSLAAV